MKYPADIGRIVTVMGENIVILIQQDNRTGHLKIEPDLFRQ